MATTSNAITNFNVEEDSYGNHILEKQDRIYIGVKEVTNMWGNKDMGKLVLALHKGLTNLVKDTDSFLVLQPTVSIPPQYVVPVEGFDKEPLQLKSDDFFFVKAPVYDVVNVQWVQKPMYATFVCKKIILSVLNTFKNCVGKNIIPGMRLEKMFLTKDNEVIFSEYTSGVITETSMVTYFLKTLFNDKGGISDTLTIELEDLIDWVDAHLLTRGSDLTKAKARVLFWTPSMRMVFIRRLADSIAEGKAGNVGTLVYTRSHKAFSHHHSTNWYDTIYKINHPVLTALLEDQDDEYKNHNSQFRRKIVPGDSGWMYLACGVVRMRDGFEHPLEEVVVESTENAWGVNTAEEGITQV